MACLLMKLRLVPDDELQEITELLNENQLEYYITGSGLLGMSLPALWLTDSSQQARAMQLLEDYAAQRQSRARELQEAMREAGRPRTFLDIAKENPLKYFCYIALLIVLLYFSIVPYMSLG